MLPIQVITRQDIERSGSTDTSELMARISANIGSFNDQLSVGEQLDPRQRPGQSTVNLRGIGDGSTLVLINGRRVANCAFDGGAVDVNSIPLAAIQRVEILTDGASAIYGTDALAGVDQLHPAQGLHQGLELKRARQSHPAWRKAGRGNSVRPMGYGDPGRDHFNAFLLLGYQKREALQAADRPFSRTGYLPDKGA